jgi:hypothetical protein
MSKWLIIFALVTLTVSACADELWWVQACSAHPEHCGMSKRHAIEGCRHLKAWHWTSANC